MDKGFYKNSKYVHLWLHLLLKANHEETEFVWNGKTQIIKPGEFITGRKILAEETKINETSVERILSFFENEHQIGQQKTTKHRLITITKWKDYQASEQQSGQQADNKRTTNEQQTDTNKKLKNDKNEKNIKQPPLPPLKRGDSEFIASKMQIKPEKQKTETAIQQLINFYKTEIEEISLDDKSWDKKFYPKYVRFAKEILDFCQENEKQAERVIYEIAEYLEEKKLDYNLATIARWRWRWKKGFEDEGE